MTFKTIGLAILSFICLIFGSFEPTASAAPLSLCDPGQRTVFSCSHGSQIFSVCTFFGSIPSESTVQYRAGKPDHLTFQYPADPDKKGGVQSFQFNSLDGSLTFKSNGYTYSVGSTAEDQDWIEVDHGTKSSSFNCNRTDPDSGLEWTDVQSYLAALGVPNAFQEMQNPAPALQGPPAPQSPQQTQANQKINPPAPGSGAAGKPGACTGGTALP